jgi:hypothetical protein
MPSDEAPRITRELPATCSTPQPSAPPCSPDPSWRQLISHAISGSISLYIAAKLLAWLPECIRMIRLPAGGVSHDPWAWAPLILDLAAAIAVAAPTSFGRLLELARFLRPQTYGAPKT